MLIIDAHQDIAFNATVLKRDYTQAVAMTRMREGPRSEEIATLGLPDALTGGVVIVFGTLYVSPVELMPGAPFYRTADEAYALAQDQLAVYRDLTRHPFIHLLETRADLDDMLDKWENGQPQQGIVLLMEGADPIRTPDELAEWQAAGLRLVGPAWTATRYCGGTGAPGPLTPAGRELLREMSRLKLALDVSHMAEESFWEALDLFDGMVIASHSNCRALAPGPNEDRHLSDAMIRAIIERDGIIGIVLFNRFLDSTWSLERGKGAIGLEAVLRHIDHVCQLSGNARNVAIGSDFDGGFGSESIPRELDSVADLPRIADALSHAGYHEKDVLSIMSDNWLRKLEGLLH